MSTGQFVKGRVPYQSVNFVIDPDEPNLILTTIEGPIVINLAQLFNLSAGTMRNVLGAQTVTASQIENAALTLAKAAVFISTEQTGNGGAQNVAHGLGVTPSKVLVIPTNTAPATVGVYTATEGAHTSTNVVVTVTSGKKYKVLAWA
jgi:hypothetical protein